MYHPLLNFGLLLKYSPISGPHLARLLRCHRQGSQICAMPSVPFSDLQNSVMGLIWFLYIQCWGTLRFSWFSLGTLLKVMAGGTRDFSSGSSGLVSGAGSSRAAILWLLETGNSWPDTCSPLLVGNLPPHPLRGPVGSTVHPTNLDSLERLEKILAVYLTHESSAISNKCLWDAIMEKVLLWVTLERMENGCLNCRENNTVHVVMRMRNKEELSTYSLLDCRQPT